MASKESAGFSSDPAQPFSVDDWLRSRIATDDYTMVELGHGDIPVAAQQDFGGRRLYVGVETWNNPDFVNGAAEKMTDLRQEKSDENVVFIYNPTVLTGRRHRKAYDPETVLPEGVANEVFFNNVFGDPLTAYRPRRTRALLQEANRLGGQNGRILIRETYTPHLVKIEKHLAALSMAVDARIRFEDDAKTWAKLEELYGPGPEETRRQFSLDSFYLFLSRLTPH